MVSDALRAGITVGSGWKRVRERQPHQRIVTYPALLLCTRVGLHYIGRSNPQIQAENEPDT
jgi:hypothetical protein